MMQTLVFTLLCILPPTAAQHLFDVDDQSSGTAVAELLQIFRDYKILEKTTPLPVPMDRIGNLTQRLRGEQAEMKKLYLAECIGGTSIDCHCASTTVKYGNKVIEFGLSYLIDRKYRQLRKNKHEFAQVCVKSESYELCAPGVYTLLPGLYRDMTQLIVDSCREFLASRLTYPLIGCGQPEPAWPPLYEPFFGDRPAYPHALPWNVELVKQDGSHWCGGFLVTPSAVVTAAHCVRVLEGLTLVVGGTTINDQDQAVQRRDKLRALLHPRADIAIVKFDEAVRMNVQTKLLCLPNANQHRIPGTILQMAGYGSTGVEHPNDLRQVGVTVSNDFECGEAYPKEANDYLVFCAGNSTDSCWADSGNAAFAKRADDVYVAYGVLSYGNGCTQPGHPGVYVKVTAVLEWIKTNLVSEE